MKNTISRLLFTCAMFASCPALAATPYGEAEGAVDHPLVGRFNGAVLHKYGTISVEHVDVKLPGNRVESAEGKVFNYFYLGPKGHSDLEVFRNYKQSLERQGFKFLHLCEDGPACVKQDLAVHAAKWTDDSRSFKGGSFYMNNLSSRPFRFMMARLSRPAGAVTVIMSLRGGYWADRGFDTDYFIQVIEDQPMATGQISLGAEKISQDLKGQGRVALYGLFFDTGKADIKAESALQLEEMAKTLKQAPTLRVIIVGHTDNQGSIDANVALSQRRAQAVVNSLTSGYKIDATRLSARGVANFSPLASNDSDAGRALNRRVEMVLQ